MELIGTSALPLPRDPAPPRQRRLRVLVLGLRGIVGVQGGIETHARKLYPLLARLGCEVEIIQRRPYFEPGRRPRRWHGVRLRYLWSPTGQGIETAVHSLLGVLYAAILRPDILHLHAVGPGLLAPLARLLGLKVVLTYHAPDYVREKFSGVEKWLLRAGETLGVRYANEPIAVSKALTADLEQRFHKEVACIPNGAPRVVRTRSTRTLTALGLSPGHYVLCVGRLDPVKRHCDLIEAFERCRHGDWKLVIVGGIEENNAYCDLIREHSAENPAIALTGYRQGLELRELYSHAGLFVLASSSEGHPIALLEALSYGVPVIASDIPANTAVPLAPDRYFPVGDIGRLARKIDACIDHPPARVSDELRHRILQEFSWRRAAVLTRRVYDKAAAGNGREHTSHWYFPWQRPF